MIFFMLYAAVAFAQTIECKDFPADGVYVVHGRSFGVQMLGCDTLQIKDQINGFAFEFTLDGKTHSAAPKAFIQYYNSRRELLHKEKIDAGRDIKKIPPVTRIEKLSYVARLDRGDDGAAVHVDVSAVIAPKDEKKLKKIHLTGHIAVYLRRKKSKDCFDCRQGELFKTSWSANVWAGNGKITKVEGGSAKDAEAYLLNALSRDDIYRHVLDPSDPNDKTKFTLEDLILVENFKRY